MVRGKAGRPPGELGVQKSMECDIFSLQCFDTVGWARGRASSLNKLGCWNVDGDDLTGVLHILQLELSLPSPSFLSSNKIQKGDILVLANPGTPGNWPLQRTERMTAVA